jgi:hypothetical protein
MGIHQLYAMFSSLPMRGRDFDLGLRPLLRRLELLDLRPSVPSKEQQTWRYKRPSTKPGSAPHLCNSNFLQCALGIVLIDLQSASISDQIFVTGTFDLLGLRHSERVTGRPQFRRGIEQSQRRQFLHTEFPSKRRYVVMDVRTMFMKLLSECLP